MTTPSWRTAPAHHPSFFPPNVSQQRTAQQPGPSRRKRIPPVRYIQRRSHRCGRRKGHIAAQCMYDVSQSVKNRIMLRPPASVSRSQSPLSPRPHAAHRRSRRLLPYVRTARLAISTMALRAGPFNSVTQHSGS